MSELNKIDSKLKKESARMFHFFKKCFQANNDVDNSQDLNLFLKYCYIDVIPTNLLSSYLQNNDIDMLNDTDFFLEKYFERLFEKSENVEQELVKTIKSKISYFEDNIKVCHKLLNNIKKTYIKFAISEFIPDSQNSKIDFMTFLPSSDSDGLKLKLGELFGRYFFAYMLILSNKNYSNYNLNNSSSAHQSTIDAFYDKQVWESFVNKDKSEIVPMQSMDKRFAFWILFLLLVGNLFGKDSSKLSVFYHYPALESYIKKIFSGQQKGKDQQHKKHQNQHKLQNQHKHQNQQQKNNIDNRQYKQYKQDFRKKMFGGNQKNLFKKILEKELQKGKKKKDGKDKQKQLSPEKLSIIDTSKLVIDKKTLAARTGLLFVNSMRWDYFYPYITNNLVDNGNVLIEKPFPHPFYPQNDFLNIKISDFLANKNSKQKTLPESDLKKVMNQFNFDIFQSLRMFDNDDNEKFIEDFYKVFSKNFLYLLYFITYTKKRIYEKYIEISRQKVNEFVFRINHPNNNYLESENYNNKSNNNSANRKPNKNFNNKRFHNNNFNNRYKNNSTIQQKKIYNNYSGLKPNILDEVLYLDKKIELIQKKIGELEKEKGTQNYERKRIELEKMIREAYIEKNKLLLKGSK